MWLQRSHLINHSLYFGVNLSVRISDITETEIDSCSAIVKELHTSCVKYDVNYSPTMWNSCNVLPGHMKQNLSDNGLGLGVNTMEGRKQKHPRLLPDTNLIVHSTHLNYHQHHHLNHHQHHHLNHYQHNHLNQ